MANVLLTTGCNLACPYCFAKEKLGSRHRRDMRLEDLDELLAFFRRSDYKLFRVMGGEPTMHPDFVAIIRRALAENLRVDVLSNATWNSECAEFFTRVPPHRLYFLLNLDHPDRYRGRMWERIESNLARLPHPRNVTLSFNIFEREPRYEYLLDIARRYRIQTVRLSFSLPILGAANQCLALEDYRDLAPFVLRFVDEAEAQDVQVQIDNAVPLCIFDDAAVGRLVLHGVLDLQRNARCEPVIDIGPDLSVWCCFCLSAVHNRRLKDFENLQQVKHYFNSILGRYQRELTPLKECNDCPHRRRWGCQGGCITHSILRHKEICPDFVLPEQEPFHVSKDARVRLADGATLRRYSIPQDCLVLEGDANSVQMELSGSVFAPMETMLDGSRSLETIIQSCRRSSTDDGESPLDLFVNEEQARGVEDALIGLIRQGLLVAESQASSDGRALMDDARAMSIRGAVEDLRS